MAYYVDGAVTPQFARAVIQLAEAWGARLTEDRIRVYAQALGHVEWDPLQRAFGACVAECRTFPTVAEILRFAQPSADDAALLAWAALSRAVEKFGSYMSIEIDDPAAAQAVADVFGSWPNLCSYDDGPGLALKRQEFLAAYRAARRSGRSGLVRLKGICEQSGTYSRTEAVHFGRILLAQGTSTCVRETRLLSGSGSDRQRLISGDDDDHADAG